MNAILDILRLERIAEEVIAKIEAELHRHRAVRVRFAGIHYRGPNGEIIMATQNIPLNTPSTAPLIFTDSTGATVVGPATGTVTTSDTTNSTVALSANGQFANVTLTGATTATLSYTGIGDGGVTITATVDVTDQPVATTATAVAFGTFAPGTTA